MSSTQKKFSLRKGRICSNSPFISKSECSFANWRYIVDLCSRNVVEKQGKSEHSAKQPIANNIEESVTSSIVIPGPQVQVDVDETKGKAKIIELSGVWKDQLNKKLIDSAVVEIPLDDVEPIRQSEYFYFFSLNSIPHSLIFTFLVDLIPCSKNIPQYYA